MSTALNPTAVLALRVVLAAVLVNTVLGSIHAFSVFLAPLETRFGVSRAAVSFIYSGTLVALTAAVLLGPRSYARWSASVIFAGVCGVAAVGAVIAGVSLSFPLAVLGYSVIFGAANGLGYGYGLQIAAQVSPGREGLAMGIVTAAYALGAIAGSFLFALALDGFGFQGAMIGLAAALVGMGALCLILLAGTGMRFAANRVREQTDSIPVFKQSLLWLGYFGGVLAGLMVLGHAAGIATALRPDVLSWSAPTMIAGFNLCGSLIGGQAADRVPLGVLLAALALLTSASLIWIAVMGGSSGLLIGLGLVGFAYGGTIAAYPAVVAKLFGMAQSARIYGRVFTAWGCAGLLGPWFAGFLFDWSGTYTLALSIAAGLGIASILPVMLVFYRR
ncbi:MAG: MFS transporter [Pseudomonadota bacterium]